MSQRFIVKSVKMNKIASTAELLNIFVFTAKNFPNQASKLFKRYVSCIKQHHHPLEKSRQIAATSLLSLAEDYDDIYKLLLRTIPELRQY